MPTNVTQTQVIVALIASWLGPWIAKQGILPADQVGTFINASVNYALDYGVPAAAAAWAWWKSRHKALVQAVQASPTEQVVTSDPKVAEGCTGRFPLAAPGAKLCLHQRRAPPAPAA